MYAWGMRREIMGWAAAAAMIVVAASPAVPAPRSTAGSGAGAGAAAPAAAAPARHAAGPAAPEGAPAAMTPAQKQAQALVDDGFFELKVENRDKAVTAFRKALEIDPKNSRARFGLGTALIAGERYAEAIRVLEGAVRNDPKDYFVRNNLAWLYATAKDVRFRDGRKAVALAQESMLLAPSDFHVWSTLAEGYFISGDYARALRSAEEAERIARASNVDPATVQEYTAQAERCRSAARAMDILE